MVNGVKILLDTNAFIYFFEGRSKVTELLIQTPIIYFSPISEIELLSASQLTTQQFSQIKNFLSLCNPVELTSDVVTTAITIRRQYRFKTPDAIIAASALHLNVPLVSADTDFSKIEGMVLITDILT